MDWKEIKYNTNELLSLLAAAYGLSRRLSAEQGLQDYQIKTLESLISTLYNFDNCTKQCLKQKRYEEEQEFLNNLKNEILQIKNRYDEILFYFETPGATFTTSQAKVADTYIDDTPTQLKYLKSTLAARFNLKIITY